MMESKGLGVEDGAGRGERLERVAASKDRQWLGALPVAIFPLVLFLLAPVERNWVHESLSLLLGINLICSLMAVVSAALIGQAFLRRPSEGLLLFGAGVLAWGVSGIAGLVAGQGRSCKDFDLNVSITVHNLCVFLSALLHLAGAMVAPRQEAFLRCWRPLLLAGYGATMALVGAIAWAAKLGLTPLFFVHGQGSTLARDFVLGSAVSIFLLTGVMLGTRKTRPLPGSMYWYMLSLFLFAIGLCGVWMVKINGSALGWAGRAAQYLGTFYLLSAALDMARHSDGKEGRFDTAINRGDYRYQLAIVLVAMSVAVRLAFLKVLGNSSPFITFYPAVMASALYGGTRVGLLATLLSAATADILWLEPAGHHSGIQDWERLLIFLVSCAMISWVSGAVQRARTRALRAEAKAQHLEVIAKAESELRRAHQELREVLGSITDGLVVLDQHWQYRFINDQGTRMLGLSRDQIIGRCAWELLPGVFGTLFQDDFQKELKAGQTVHFEEPNPGPPPRWLECYCYPSEQKVSVYFRDITERKLAEEALRTSESRYRSLFENNLDPIFSVNSEGRFLSANPAAEALSGYTCQELQARTFAELCVPDRLEQTMASFIASLQAQQPGVETAMLRKDGRRVELFITSVSVRLGGDSTLFCIARDITARKREERARTLAMDLLSFANASTSTEQFIRATLAFLRKFLGCDAIGLRLRDEEGYPSYASLGFPPGFFGNGKNGSPNPGARQVGHQLCPMIVGEHGAIKKLLTPNGTFWSADLPWMQQRLLARGLQVAEEACFCHGYQSMAIIPLGNRGQRSGILKLCSKRKGHFGPEDVELMEQLADKLSIAIGRFQIEEARAKAVRVLEERVAERTEELRRANRALLALKDCGEVLARAKSEPELLEKVCELIAGMDGIELAWVGMAEQNEAKTVRPVAHAGRGCGILADSTITWADAEDGGGPASSAIRGRKVYRCGDIEAEERCEPVRKKQVAYGFASSISLPLIWGGQCLGALTIYSGLVNAFNDQETDLLAQLAGEVAHGVKALRTRAERERLKEELFRISEREKQAIAREIHDGLCQHLSGTAMLASLLHRKLASLNSSSAHVAKQIEDLLNTGTEEARNLSHGLHPVSGEPEALMAALAGLARMITKLFGVECTFDCPAPVLIQDATVANHLFRIAQESTNNAIKHGKPSGIRVLLEKRAGTIVLSIRDDGVGISSGLENSKGLGLQILRYRAAEIGAALEIRPAEDGGTLVECALLLECAVGAV